MKIAISDKPFIIAELSGNHGGSLDKAFAMIDAAAAAGCDAVKIQAYEPEDLCDPANNALYEKSKTPRDWFPGLFACARDAGIPLFSSVFSPWAIDCLEQYDCPAYKLASPESTRLKNETYLSLAARIRQTGKQFYVSSGKADLPFMLLLRPDLAFYCKAGYPAKIDVADIGTVSGLVVGGLKVGFSDHTVNPMETLAMIGAGAGVIEKHFKIDDDCVDTAFSLNPDQMKFLCSVAHKSNPF